MEKKKHTGRNVALIIVGVVVLIPALLFAYLSLMGFGAEKMRARYDAQAPYDGRTGINADGTASFTLGRNEFFYFIDEYGFEDDAAEALASITDAVSIKAVAADAVASGLTIYADAVAFGFIPLPLKAECSVTLPQEGDKVMLKIQSAYLGKWIKLPLDKLGVDGEFEVELSELDATLTGVSFADDGMTLTQRFLDEYYVYPGYDVSQLAHVITMYENDGLYPSDPLIGLCADKYAVTLKELFEYVASSADQRAALTELLALSNDAVSSALLRKLEPYEKRFIYPCGSDEVERVRNALYALPAEGQRRYQTLLDALRKKYCALELQLDETAFNDLSTGEPLLLSSLQGMGWVDDEATRVALIYSLDAAYAVMTSDMPQLADVPDTGRKATKDIYTDMTYDLALVTLMPDGMPAVIYYVAKGYFVINEISAEQYESYMSAQRLPVILSDELPKPPTRTNYPAPADDLMQYTALFMPVTAQG